MKRQLVALNPSTPQRRSSTLRKKNLVHAPMMSKVDAKYDKFLTFLRAIENDESNPTTSSKKMLDSAQHTQRRSTAAFPADMHQAKSRRSKALEPQAPHRSSLRCKDDPREFRGSISFSTVHTRLFELIDDDDDETSGIILTNSYRFSDIMCEDLEKHQSEWEERTKSMKTRAIKHRANKAKQQRKEKKLLSSALVVSEDSNSTACDRKENEDKESKVLQSERKRRNIWFPLRKKGQVACAI